MRFAATPPFVAVAAAVLTVSLLVQPSAACSCLATSFADNICGSDIVLRGSVIASYDNCEPSTCDPIDDQVDGRFFYIVRISRIYNTSPTAPSFSDGVVVLSTAVNGGLCGISLPVATRTQYLFALRDIPSVTPQGNLPTLPIFLCGPSAIPWRSLNASSRFFVRRLPTSCDAIS